jgi:hypothetical protein
VQALLRELVYPRRQVLHMEDHSIPATRLLGVAVGHRA